MGGDNRQSAERRDIVLIRHDDHVHFDPDGIAAVAGPDATIGAHRDIDTAALDRPSVSLPLTGSTVIDDCTITSVPAYNSATGDHVDADGTPFHRKDELPGLYIECGKRRYATRLTRIFFVTTRI